MGISGKIHSSLILFYPKRRFTFVNLRPFLKMGRASLIPASLIKDPFGLILHTGGLSHYFIHEIGDGDNWKIQFVTHPFWPKEKVQFCKLTTFSYDQNFPLTPVSLVRGSIWPLPSHQRVIMLFFSWDRSHF